MPDLLKHFIDLSVKYQKQCVFLDDRESNYEIAMRVFAKRQGRDLNIEQPP